MNRRRSVFVALIALALILVPTAVVAAPTPGGASPAEAVPAATPGGASPGGAGTGTGTGTTPVPTTPTSPARPTRPTVPTERAVMQPGPLTLRSAALTQDGTVLVWSAATGEYWSPASLRRARQSLCVRLVFEAGGKVESRDVCVRRRGAAATLTLTRVLRDGGHGPVHPLAARVAKPSPRSLTARFDPARIGIPAASRVRWRTISSTDGCDLASGRACFQARPADGAVLTLAAPKPVACIPAGPAYITNGPRTQKVVALTFDDGPSTLTPAFLDVLRAKGVKGTFFMIGQQVAPNASIVQRMLAEGHELADHTWSHATVSAGGDFAAGQISSTANAIRTASGFMPCAFRAPGGAVSNSLIGLARGLGFTTVQWDVDPQDWRTPGTEAIYSRIVGGARNGSIILMHDGGGPRTQTLAALPRIIDTLRARGYRFATIAELTGSTFTYR